MTKSPKKKSAPSLNDEFASDAWERFESLIRSAAKMGHQPHKPATPPQPKAAAEKKRQPPVAKK